MTDFDFTLSAMEKLVKARVKLQKEKPFFSFLLMNLNFIEDNKATPTMGIDKFGNCYFNPKFVDSLSQEEIKGVICHEVLHCAFEHMDRCKDRYQPVFNISGDIVINNIILEQGMSLPEGSLLPENNKIKAYGVTVKDIKDKTAEEVYDDLWSVLRKQYDNAMKQIEDFIKNHSDGKKGFDKHIYSDGNGKGDKDKEDKTGSGNIFLPKDWKNILVDACEFARQRGDLPAGMERIVGKLLETYIDWRGLLYRYITSQIPVDFSYSRPAKRSYSMGYYFPTVVREQIEILCAVDTSGSISEKDLSEFLSEMTSIVKSFRNVDLTVIDCDADVHGVHDLKHATVGEIISKIGSKLKGGGGTSHIPVFNWINKNRPSTKFVICFTDGYTSFPNRNNVKQPVLWVLCSESDLHKKDIPFGEVIELPKRRN